MGNGKFLVASNPNSVEPCPECQTPNEKYKADYVGEDGNDGVDYFFKCSKCNTDYETWYSRGSGGYTLSWSGGNKYIEPTPAPPPPSTPRFVLAWSSMRLPTRTMPITRAPPREDEPRPAGATIVLSFVLYLVACLILILLDPINIQTAINNIPTLFVFFGSLVVGFLMESGCLLCIASLAGLYLGSGLFGKLVILNPTLIWGFLALGFVLSVWAWVRTRSSGATSWVGWLAFFGLVGWQLIGLKATTFTVYNGLNRAVSVTIPDGEVITLQSGEFNTTALPAGGQLVSRLNDGTVVEAIELSARSALFSKSLLYNIKSRGKLHLDSSHGVKLDSNSVHLKVTGLAHRGVTVVTPGKQPPPYRHWVRIRELDELTESRGK